VLLTRQDEVRAEAREAAKEAKALAESRSAAAAQQSREKFEEATDYVVNELRKRVPFTELKEGETPEAVFEAVARTVKSTDFEAMSPELKATAVASVPLLKRTIRQLADAQEKIATLEANVKRRSKTTPSLSGDSPDPDTSEDFGGDLDAAVSATLGMDPDGDFLAKLKAMEQS
jgi:hypothetical protein